MTSYATYNQPVTLPANPYTTSSYSGVSTAATLPGGYTDYPTEGFGGYRLYVSQATCLMATNSSDLIAVQSWALDTCIDYPSGGYVKYACSGYSTIAKTYASSDCSGTPSSTTTVVPNGVCTSITTSTYGTAGFAAPFCNGQITPYSTDLYIADDYGSYGDGYALNTCLTSDQGTSSYIVASVIAEASDEVLSIKTEYTDPACTDVKGVGNPTYSYSYLLSDIYATKGTYGYR
jgi:hypothetical protein